MGPAVRDVWGNSASDSSLLCQKSKKFAEFSGLFLPAASSRQLWLRKTKWTWIYEREARACEEVREACSCLSLRVRFPTISLFHTEFMFIYLSWRQGVEESRKSGFNNAFPLSHFNFKSARQCHEVEIAGPTAVSLTVSPTQWIRSHEVCVENK